MKIQIASDLHHELAGSGLATSRALRVSNHADVLVLAGNVSLGTQAFSLYGKGEVPVIYVYGNHELHGSDIQQARDTFASQKGALNLKFLERSELLYGGVRFLGCCLWVDYALGRYPREIAMREANRFLVDHRLIRNGDRRFLAEDALREHEVARTWLEERLMSSPATHKTVVVTHFGPSLDSVPLLLRREVWASSFASALEKLIPLADLWIHGHVHDRLEYSVEGTRVLCNGRGYPWDSSSLRGAFDPELLVEI